MCFEQLLTEGKEKRVNHMWYMYSSKDKFRKAITAATYSDGVITKIRNNIKISVFKIKGCLKTKKKKLI